MILKDHFYVLPSPYRCFVLSETARLEMLNNRDALPEKDAYEYICQFGIMVLVIINSLLELLQWYRVRVKFQIDLWYLRIKNTIFL